jgi:HEAT repeat protein
LISGDNFSVSPAESARVQRAQLLAIKSSGDQGELLEMLADPSWVVRRAVVEALASLGDSSVEELCNVLRSRRDNEARIAAAVDALSTSRSANVTAVMKLAGERDPAIVSDAIQVLGRRRSDAAVPLLIKLTKNENDIVAVSALEALGRIGGRAAVEALIETVGTGSFFRTFPAIDILGRSGDPRAVEPLAKLLKSPNYLPEAARALGRSGERGAVGPLLELFTSPTDSVVRVAALALWELRDRFEEKAGGASVAIDDVLRIHVTPEMVRRLSRIMSSLDTSEAMAICRLLGAVRSEEAAPLLTMRLDGPAAVAECAAEALKRIGKESDLHVLQALRSGDSARRKVLLPVVSRSAAALDVAKCLSDHDAEVRALACDTIARLGNASVVSEVFQLLGDSNLRVVHSATAAIQSLGTREARQLSIDASKSSNAVVRRAALRILAYFGDREALQPMLDGLRDNDARVREVAIQGLPYLENPLAVAALYEVSKNPDPRTRALAMRALGQMAKPDERTYSILLRGLNDSDAWARYYSCQSIGRLAYSPAALEVAKLLEDEAGQVRVSAVEALSHLESPEAHRALKQAAISEEPDVKRAALVGLGIVHRLEDLPIVMSAAASSDMSTRLIALSAMVSFQAPIVVGALSSAAVDSDEQVRAAAIGFLATRSEQEATEVLVELLGSDTTRELAKTALQVPNVGRVAGLLAALETANDELAPLLISVLARIQRPEARKAMITAIKLRNVAARKAAATGLAANRDAEKIAVLREAADNDPDRSVRNICALLIAD